MRRRGRGGGGFWFLALTSVALRAPSVSAKNQRREDQNRNILLC